MVLGAVLHAPGAPIEHVYFPLSGMVSLLTVMKTGEQIETAIVGREGVVGAAIGSDGLRSASQATVQIAGSAWQVQRGNFLELYQASAPFRTLMNQFQNVILVQAQQTAACHALHTVQARLCRWLLQSQDVTDSDIVPLTQEFLSHMLGVQRSSVSLCAHALQDAGLIQYTRGQIKILSREGLKESACECYEVIRDHIDHRTLGQQIIVENVPGAGGTADRTRFDSAAPRGDRVQFPRGTKTKVLAVDRAKRRFSLSQASDACNAADGMARPTQVAPSLPVATSKETTYRHRDPLESYYRQWLRLLPRRR
jgi:CRP-like cAMP-binding protein